MMANDKEEATAPPENDPESNNEQAAAGDSPSMLQIDLGDQSTLAYVGMFFSAIVLLVALTSSKVGDYKENKFYEYGISLASIAMIFSLVGFFLRSNDRIAMYNNYFLFVWCFIGACIMTFGDGPFLTTSNGYFASWGLAVFATMGLGVNASRAAQEATSGAGPVLGLLASSIITLAAIASWGIKKSDDFFGELVYGLVVSILTILAAGAVFKMERDAQAQVPRVKLPVMVVFAILWIVAAGLLTFRGPFVLTSNGYFGSWGGAVTSVFAANAARMALAS